MLLLLLLLLLLSHFSCVQRDVTPETAAHQAPPSLGFSRQEYWSQLPLPSPRSHISILNFEGSAKPFLISSGSTVFLSGVSRTVWQS